MLIILSQYRIDGFDQVLAHGIVDRHDDADDRPLLQRRKHAPRYHGIVSRRLTPSSPFLISSFGSRALGFDNRRGEPIRVPDRLSAARVLQPVQYRNNEAILDRAVPGQQSPA